LNFAKRFDPRGKGHHDQKPRVQILTRPLQPQPENSQEIALRAFASLTDLGIFFLECEDLLVAFKLRKNCSKAFRLFLFVHLSQNHALVEHSFFFMICSLDGIKPDNDGERSLRNRR
jgi:hypothetical protein